MVIWASVLPIPRLIFTIPWVIKRVVLVKLEGMQYFLNKSQERAINFCYCTYTLLAFETQHLLPLMAESLGCSISSRVTVNNTL